MWAALLIGFLGGFHCVVMCGPLVLYLRHKRNTYGIPEFVLHQFGRLLGYAILGGIAGWVGFGFSLVSLHRYVSILLGVLLLYSSLSTLFSFPYFLSLNHLFKVNSRIGSLFGRLSTTSIVSLGLLNALLPCGLVYTALAASTALFDPIKSMLFMGLFGLGTVPALVLSYSISTSTFIAKQKRFRVVLPITTALVGVLLILRGLTIGIPFVSPPKKHLEVSPKGSNYECVELKKAPSDSRTYRVKRLLSFNAEVLLRL